VTTKSETLPALTTGDAITPAWRVSTSLASARPGEVLLLDEHGQVMGGQAMRRQQLAAWTAVSGVAGVGVIAVGALAGPLVGLVSGVVFGAMMWRQTRAWRKAREALVLASAGRRDEALAAVERLESGRIAEPLRPFLFYLKGKLEWQRGNFDVALALYDRAIGSVGPRRRRAMYWVCAFDRAQLLAVMGKVDAARTARADLDGAPRGDYFALELALTDLVIAFAASDTGLLPPDEDLFDWAKLALGLNRFGTNLVLLAWALGARGEADMEKLLLREASPRLTTEFLGESFPKLATWYGARRVEIGADREEDLDDL
jgi:tetratricopeptide (TPR) repeat protein